MAETLRIIAVTSGKGGVGKTNVSLNLAIALARRKKKVCIFDADMGMANINVLLGLAPQFDIQHVIAGEKTLKEILLKSHEGIEIIPNSSGIQEVANIEKDELKRLITDFMILGKELDYLLIDTASGISSSVISFVMAAHEVIVVVTKEPTSLVDGYGLIKVILEMGYKKPINILVNMVPSYKLGERIYHKLSETIKNRYVADISHLGTLLSDPALPEAVCRQKPLIISNPQSPASLTFMRLSGAMAGKEEAQEEDPNAFVDFWVQILKVRKNPLLKKDKKEEPPPVTTAKEEGVPKESKKEQGMLTVMEKLIEATSGKVVDGEKVSAVTDMERYYIDKLEFHLEKYHEFVELSHIAGEGNFFREIDYRSFLLKKEAEIRLSLEDLSNPFINAVMKFFEEMAGIHLKAGKPVVKESLSYGDIRGAVRLAGVRSFSASLFFHKKGIEAIASKILGESVSYYNNQGNIDSAIKDLVAEMIYIVSGEAKRVMAEKGYTFSSSYPKIHTVDEGSFRLKGRHLIIPFHAEEGFINLEVG